MVALWSRLLLLPLAVIGHVACQANDTECATDQGPDSSILMQKKVAVQARSETLNSIITERFNDTLDATVKKKKVGVQSHANAVAPASTMPLSEEEIRKGLAKKQGMNANCGVGEAILDQFTDTSSWFWTYSLAPCPKALEWGQKNNKEFVALVNLKEILPCESKPKKRGKKYKGQDRKAHCKKCSFHEGTCTIDMLVEALNETKSKITTRYLMGYNEPYADHQQASAHGSKHLKGVNGTEGARWWRLWVQPAAERLNLELVSPTTGISKQKTRWMIEFLQACYDSKDDPDFPCKVEKIKIFSIHEYKCYANYWHKYAALDGGADVEMQDPKCGGGFKPRKETNFYVNMKAAMRERYGDAVAKDFWDPYFDAAKLWVTETSCSGDLRFNKKNYDKNGKTLPGVGKSPTKEEHCQYMTGQSCHHGEGSIAAMLALDNVERFSWFSLYANPKWNHPNRESILAGVMMDANTSASRPPGRALLSALNADSC